MCGDIDFQLQELLPFLPPYPEALLGVLRQLDVFHRLLDFLQRGSERDVVHEGLLQVVGDEVDKPVRNLVFILLLVLLVELGRGHQCQLGMAARIHRAKARAHLHTGQQLPTGVAGQGGDSLVGALYPEAVGEAAGWIQSCAEVEPF